MDFNSKLYDECISWIDGDLSLMSKSDRESLYESYGWMFSDSCKCCPSLEPLISDPRRDTYRVRYKEWFSVVCDFSLSSQHMGETSYYHYMRHPYWNGTKTKGNKVYPQRVILALGMMGVFTGIKSDYLHTNDKTIDHGRVYTVDLDRLNEWTSDLTGLSGGFYVTSTWEAPTEDIWVVSSSDEFDYSFLEGSDDESLDTWNLHSDWFSSRQRETISTISVLPEYYGKAQQFISTHSYQMMTDKESRGYYRSCKWLVNLHDGDVGRCKVDDKGGRFYTMMVGLGKDYRRNCLLLDGERIVEVDVSSSQPTLIGLKVKKESGVTSQWLSHCLSGDFYEWVKSVTATKVARDKVKKYVMKFLFSCYESDRPKDYEGEHCPQDDKEGKRGYKKFAQRLTDYLKVNEPEVYDLIERRKRNPYWTDKVWKDSFKKQHKGKWCSGLPVEMQKVEVEYIKTCLARLPQDMKFYTIHDSICVKESDGEKVKEIMQQVSMEMYGEKIAVKIENTLADRD